MYETPAGTVLRAAHIDLEGAPALARLVLRALHALPCMPCLACPAFPAFLAHFVLPLPAGVTMDREVRRLRDTLSARFADVCYNGFWFSPEMEFLLHAIRKSQEVRHRSPSLPRLLLILRAAQRVTGEVEVELFQGTAMARGRDSPYSLYDKQLVSMDEEGGYDPTLATGFIRIQSLRLVAHHKLAQRAGH